MKLTSWGDAGLVNQPKVWHDFMTWYKKEKAKGLAWVQNIPKCPCKLKFVPARRECYTTDAWYGVHGNHSARTVERYIPKRWEHPNPDKKGYWYNAKVPTSWEEKLHPGVAYTMRSKGIRDAKGKFHYNQCTYDHRGRLYTEPPAAGSIDWAKALKISDWKTLMSSHPSDDVQPAVWANELDGGGLIWYMAPHGNKMQKPAGEYVKMYYEVRPSWHENCPRQA